MLGQETYLNFRPPWYLRNGHVQTLITGFYRPLATLPVATVHRVPIEPWGHMLIHENKPERADPDRPAVLLLHGLGSSHAGTYMTSIAGALLAKGCRVFRADLPGAGPSYRTTSLPPHGACYDLVRDSLNWLSQQLSIPRWRMAGVSLGGNLLLKMLAESSLDPTRYPWSFEVDRAIAVAPPIDLAECCRNMEIGINRLYANYFLRALKKQANLRADLWPEWKKVLAGADYSTVRRFDDTVTSRLAGFRDADDYYDAGSSTSVLKHITIPTHILIDQHDPIVPAALFERTEYSPTTRLVRTHFGGHVGYLHRPSPTSSSSRKTWTRWADTWIADQLAMP